MSKRAERERHNVEIRMAYAMGYNKGLDAGLRALLVMMDKRQLAYVRRQTEDYIRKQKESTVGKKEANQ